VAALQRLHNYLAVNRPKALAAMGPPLEQDLVTLTIVLLNRLPGER
jgi:hypothetical protein